MAGNGPKGERPHDGKSGKMLSGTELDHMSTVWNTALGGFCLG